MTKALLAALGAIALTTPALADGWTLDGDSSHLAFGSVKNTYIGEVHSFGDLSGTVGADGATVIEIGLTSVETYIDIRNERMVEHVFGNGPNATISTDIDIAELDGLGVGDTMMITVDATLALLGVESSYPADLFVARLGEDRVMVTSNDFVYIATDELGIDDGIDMLQELAGLDSITRAVPVSMRFIFDMD
ncbi:MAG: YceI family protein [Pseudomonadota bacterium]